MIDGYSYGLNYGLVGMGSNNSRGTYDNVAVQILPPQITLDATDNFAGDPALAFDPMIGPWDTDGDRYAVIPSGQSAMSLVDLRVEHLSANSYLEVKAKVNTRGRTGFVFDRYECAATRGSVVRCFADR